MNCGNYDFCTNNLSARDKTKFNLPNRFPDKINVMLDNVTCMSWQYTDRVCSCQYTQSKFTHTNEQTLMQHEWRTCNGFLNKYTFLCDEEIFFSLNNYVLSTRQSKFLFIVFFFSSSSNSEERRKNNEILFNIHNDIT